MIADLLDPGFRVSRHGETLATGARPWEMGSIRRLLAASAVQVVVERPRVRALVSDETRIASSVEVFGLGVPRGSAGPAQQRDIPSIRCRTASAGWFVASVTGDALRGALDAQRSELPRAFDTCRGERDVFDGHSLERVTVGLLQEASLKSLFHSRFELGAG